MGKSDPPQSRPGFSIREFFERTNGRTQGEIKERKPAENAMKPEIS
jgi:hypothetical protein